LQWTNNQKNQETTTISGAKWEKYAEQYLTQQGLTAFSKNFHSRQGEIDLVMNDDGTIVFVEVKYRKSGHFGGAIATITDTKRKKLTKTAKVFLHQHGFNEYNTDCRFDVIAIEGESSSPNVTWLKNAF